MHKEASGQTSLSLFAVPGGVMELQTAGEKTTNMQEIKGAQNSVGQKTDGS